LLHRIRGLRQEGFTRIILAVHYLAEHFEAFVNAQRDLDVELRLLMEPEPLGTGGALRHAITAVETPTLVVLNGDSWLRQPAAPVVAEHLRQGRAFTIVAVRAEHVEGGARRKGLLTIGAHDELVGFATGDAVVGWVNAGLYVLQTALVRRWPSGRYDLEQELMRLVPPGQGTVYRSEGSLLDIGTPRRYAHAARFLMEAEVAA